MSEPQRRDRVRALSNAIGVPAPDSLLRLDLIEHGWDVNLAAQAFHARVAAEASQTTSSSAQASSSRRQRRGQDRRQGQSVGPARAQTVRRFRDMISQDMSQNNIENHRMTDILGLLYRHEWDVERAGTDYREARGNLQQERESFQALRTHHPDEVLRDQLLAAFIGITDADNWYDALRFLEKNKWDITAALDKWYSASGVLPRTKPEKGIRDGGFRVFRQPVVGPEDDNASSSASSSASTPPPPSSATSQSLGKRKQRDWSPASSYNSEQDIKEKKGDQTAKSRGSIIGRDEFDIAKRNCPDPTKLVVEKIDKGRYSYLLFNKRDKATGKFIRFNDSDHESDDEKVELDWCDPSHISQLNAWRRQIHRRAGDETVFQRREAYTEEENEYIWGLHCEHLEEVLGKDPQYFDNGGRIPLTVSPALLREWASRFNDNFASATRPARTAGSIEAQRHRITGVVREFMVPQNVAHPGSGTGRTGRGHGNLKARLEQDSKDTGKAKAEDTDTDVSQAPAGPSRKRRAERSDDGSDEDGPADKKVKR